MRNFGKTKGTFYCYLLCGLFVFMLLILLLLDAIDICNLLCN